MITMVMNLDVLSGSTLRKALNASRVRMSYHNKHKDGSGNFGFVIVYEHDGVKDAGCGMTVANESWFQLSGAYTGQKQVYGLTFGTYSRPISRIPNEWTYQQVLDYMLRFIEQAENPDGKTFVLS